MLIAGYLWGYLLGAGERPIDFRHKLKLPDLDRADLVFRDLGHGIQGVEGQQVGRCLLEMKGHEDDPRRKIVGNLRFHLDLAAAGGDFDQSVIRLDSQAWRVFGIDLDHSLRIDLRESLRLPADHRVVVVKHPAGGQQERIFLVGKFRSGRIGRDVKFSLAPGEFIFVQEGSARMVLRRAGPLESQTLPTVRSGCPRRRASGRRSRP